MPEDVSVLPTLEAETLDEGSEEHRASNTDLTYDPVSEQSPDNSSRDPAAEEFAMKLPQLPPELQDIIILVHRRSGTGPGK